MMDSSDEEDLILTLVLKDKLKRKKRRMWVRSNFLLRDSCGEFNRTFLALMSERDEHMFFNYMRMSYTTYEELRNRMLPLLQPIANNYRQPISAEQKLVLTLRHLVTGGSFASMSVPFHMSKVTIGKHILSTCKVIWDVLQPDELPFPTEELWQSIAKRFGEVWNHPFAIGALDGKHVALINPARSGSRYYNYKGFPSIVLMALSDADSCFIIVDCGQYGRVSDAGVYNASCISTLLEEQRLNIPHTTFNVSGSETAVPFTIVGDEAFPLKPYLMKPYAARTLDTKRRVYNYRHSRARRTVECAFGILAKKFEVFQRPMRVGADKAVVITKAAVALHNFVRRREGRMSDESSQIVYGNTTSLREGLLPLSSDSTRRANNDALRIRDTICDFFSDPNGSVEWQNNLVFRNV